MFLCIFILDRFFKHRPKKQKTKSESTVTYVNGINIIAYKNIYGKMEGVKEEASDKDIGSGFFHYHK
jgi:hypothetical protein